jgi:phosphonate transport system permease protein
MIHALHGLEYGMASVPAVRDNIDRLYRRGYRQHLLRVLAVLGVVAVCLWYGGFFEVQRYLKGIPHVFRIIVTEGLPPDFSRYREWAKALLDTIVMSVGGTAVAIALSFPLGFLAAWNTTPQRVVYVAARGLLNLFRAIPELILGIILVSAVSLGLLPGIWALGLHSVGMVGKFFAEAIEHVDPAPIEAITATGASRLQVLWHGVLPQVWPRLADVAFYRWEYNFRASTVLGMVGCGGIGQEIQTALSLMEYRQLSALLLVVLACVWAVDSLSNRLRRTTQ